VDVVVPDRDLAARLQLGVGLVWQLVGYVRWVSANREIFGSAFEIDTITTLDVVYLFSMLELRLLVCWLTRWRIWVLLSSKVHSQL